MSSIKFFDYTEKVKGVMEQVAQSALEEVCGELESQVKRNTAVDTGQTKNSWTHQVTSTDGTHTGIVGSPMENAIWEEFGTGEYSLNSNGRKGGWFYKDAKGDGHFTHGKKPRRAFHKAYTSLKSKIIKHLQDRFKGGLS